jgi:nucleoside 2-deoxyribosyltransferase
MIKAYLAGPDVFRPDWREHSERLKEVCRGFGVEGRFPLDQEVDRFANVAKQEVAHRIRRANINLIRWCDLVLANVSPFRGPNADDGTAWEVGYATALGKPVFCYSDGLSTLRDKVYYDLFDRDDGSSLRAETGNDLNGWAVEDFDLPVNLMLVDPATGGIHRSIVAALQYWRDGIALKELAK